MKNTWRFKGNELKYLKEVIGSGEFSSTSGDMNKRLETAFCEKYGSEYAVTFNSGTSTLHASLVAAGIGYGDEVIQPALSVISNLQSTLAVNAIPVFADINPYTFNIDVEDIKKKITPKTKAIQVVPLYGLPCDFDEIMELARNHNLIVINDAAEAVGAKYKSKDMAICGDIASFSFENSKHLTTGDGGIITTNSDILALEARSFCNLGSTSVRSGDGRIRDAKDQRSKDKFQNPNYQRCDSLGLNYRMPEVAAAVGLAQLEKADLYVKKRINIAKMYLDCIDGCEWLVPQKVPNDFIHSYWTFAVKMINPNIDWQDFRIKYIENGGDGIFAAWKVVYEEPFIKNDTWKKHAPDLYNNISFEKCNNAEVLQKQLMQFVNNYETSLEAEKKVAALSKTIKYFN